MEKIDNADAFLRSMRDDAHRASLKEKAQNITREYMNLLTWLSVNHPDIADEYERSRNAMG